MEKEVRVVAIAKQSRSRSVEMDDSRAHFWRRHSLNGVQTPVYGEIASLTGHDITIYAPDTPYDGFPYSSHTPTNSKTLILSTHPPPTHIRFSWWVEVYFIDKWMHRAWITRCAGIRPPSRISTISGPKLRCHCTMQQRQRPESDSGGARRVKIRQRRGCRQRD